MSAVLLVFSLQCSSIAVIVVGHDCCSLTSAFECSLCPKLPLCHTHTRLTALFPGPSRRADTRKVKPIWIIMKQETVSGSDISWAVCKSAPHSRQITIPAPHRSVFLQAGCPSCCPTNSVKALKAIPIYNLTITKHKFKNCSYLCAHRCAQL